jgi:hypothetical protein
VGRRHVGRRHWAGTETRLSEQIESNWREVSPAQPSGDAACQSLFYVRMFGRNCKSGGDS